MKTQTESQLPNYRIYDRTGGGVTEDIYAESLEDAIEEGRAWIEAGDWSGLAGEDSGEGRQYVIGVPLECSVREIVRYDDSQDDGEAGEIDDDATVAGDEYDCSGEYSDTLPDCEQAEHASADDEADEEGHVWRSPYSVVGGCKENPGVWGGNGTAMNFHEVCRLCGCHKHTHSYGSQRNDGDPREKITIKDRDEESEAWLKRTHEDEGFIPDWLAEMLDCLPTLRMTEAQAREYVAEHNDDGDLDEDDLEHAFAAIFGRRVNDEDRNEGLWSHLCAAIPAE
jgi:hypothetical protein